MTYCTEQRNRFLAFLARKTVQKYEPGLIAVAGSRGKTAAVEMLYTTLRDLREVGKTSNSFDAEIQAPLALIHAPAKGNGCMFWVNTLGCTLENLLHKNPGYPELIILEYAARNHRAVERLLALGKPSIAVITALHNLPPYELAKIITGLPSNGYAILNYDDPASYGMKERTRAPILSYGMNEGAAMRVVNLEHRVEELPDGTIKPLGISFKLACGEALVPVRLDNAFGKSSAYAASAAACVGTVFGMNLVRIAEAIHYYAAPPRHLQLVPGKKGAYLFDDTADASIVAAHEALDMLEALPARRVIIVFGALHAHEDPAEEYLEALVARAAKISTKLVLIGRVAPAIDKKNILRFDSGEAAAHETQGILERGDLILVKGAGAEAAARELRSHRAP